MLRSTVSLLAVLALAAAAAGCGGNNNAPTAPTAPEAVAQTEVFAGEGLNPNGARVHPFAVQAAGQVTATLTTIEPASRVGLALGTWNSALNTCNVTVVNDAAQLGSILFGTTSTAGNLCVRIFDNGGLTGLASYAVTVTHF